MNRSLLSIISTLIASLFFFVTATANAQSCDYSVNSGDITDLISTIEQANSNSHSYHQPN